MKFHCMLKKLKLHKEEYVLMQAISLFSPGDGSPQLLETSGDPQEAGGPTSCHQPCCCFPVLC